MNRFENGLTGYDSRLVLIVHKLIPLIENIFRKPIITIVINNCLRPI